MLKPDIFMRVKWNPNVRLSETTPAWENPKYW